MTVATYTALDVSERSALTQNLNERGAEEARSAEHGPIVLTSVADLEAPAANLTPGMRQWLATQVGGVRQLALSEISARARAIRVAGIDGIVIDFEEDRIEREKQRKIADSVERFTSKNRTRIDRVATLQREYDDIRQSQGGRDAKTPSKWLEWCLLLPLIVFPEALLNFKSFQKAPIISSDAMALGSTLLVGGALAVASFLIGLFVLRVRYYMHPEDKQRRSRGLSMLSWGSLLLALGLSAVAVARYYYLIPLIQDAILTGSPIPSMAVSIGGLLFGNLICFALGVAVTFMLNDPHEIYSVKAVDLRHSRTDLESLRRKHLYREVEAARETARQEVEQARNRDRQMSTVSGYSELKTALAQIQAKDANVVGALEKYRAAVASAIRVANPRYEFKQFVAAIDRGDSTRHVPINEFLQLDIRLWRQA